MGRAAGLAAGLAVLVFGRPAGGSEPPRVDPAAVDRLAEEAIRRWAVPGLAVVVVRGGEVAHLKGYGTKRGGAVDPVTADTLFPLASCSKAFTTTLLAMLVDDGRVGWDDPVRRHLPGFRLSDPHADALVTLRDLLAHRTGVDGHDYLWYRAPWGIDEAVRRAAELPLNGPFRGGYRYSTLMYLAAGRAAAAAGGAPWDRLVRERICGPLGMTGVAFTSAEAGRAADRATGHRRTAAGRVEPMPGYPMPEPNPAGSVHATARDLGRWVRFHLAGGVAADGTRLVSAANLAETHAPQTVIRKDDPGVGPVYPDSHQVSYGLGWVAYDHRGRRVVAHGGIVDGFRAQVTLLPDDGVGFALVNNLHKTRMNLALGNALIDELLGLPPKDWHGHFEGVDRAEREAAAGAAPRGGRPSAPLARFAGRYLAPAYGTATVAADGDGLVWEWGSFRCRLEHYRDDVFRFADGEFEGQAVDFRVRDGTPDAFKAIGVVFARTP